MLPESAYTRGATLAGKPLTGLVDAAQGAATSSTTARPSCFQGLHRYWPPLARAGRRARARARPPLPGQRLPHPARLAGLRGALRHPRRLRVPDPRHQACGRCTTDGERRAAVILEPGLSMYLPTGTPHAARAQDTRLAARDHRHQPAHLAQAARPGRGRDPRRHRRRAPAGRLPRRPGPARRRAGRPARGPRRRPARRRPGRGRRTPRSAASSPAAPCGSAAACATARGRAT